MQPRKTTKKQAKVVRRTQILLIFLILIFISINVLLVYKILSHKSILFISPISSTGFPKNSNFEEKLKKAEIQFSNLKITGEIYSFDIKDQGNVIFTNTKSIDEQVSSLQLIVRRLKIEGKRFKSLNFRYDKPVIILY